MRLGVAFLLSLVRDRAMSTSLRTFIAERRVQLLREIEKLRTELADLDKAEAAVGGLVGLQRFQM